MKIDLDQSLITEVYEDLKAVIGDQKAQWPTISILGVPNRIGSYVAKENRIYIDQKAIEVCKRFGIKTKAAIAFIVGHELTHFYQKHEWGTSGFVSHFMVSVENFRENREHERQADIFGGFIAQQAGYPTLALASQLLEQLYTDYNISARQDAQYPSLAERKVLLHESCEIAGDLINAYHSANYLMISGHFEEAFVLYEYVSRSIKFKELFNNMGVASLSSFLHLNNDPLIYPLEIDTKIPIERATLFRSKQEMVFAAEKYFRLSYSYDKRYKDAAIHLVAALGLGQRFFEARQLYKVLEKGILAAHQQAKLKLILGNLHYRQGQNDEAKAFFQEALKISTNPALVKMIKKNLQYLKKGKRTEGKAYFIPAQIITGKTDEVDIATFESYLRQLDVNPNCQLQTVELSHSTLSSFESRGKKLKVQKVHSQKLKKRNVGIGSSRGDIERNFSDIDFEEISFNGGYYLVSIKYGLIFKLGKEGLIQEWVIFMI